MHRRPLLSRRYFGVRVARHRFLSLTFIEKKESGVEPRALQSIFGYNDLTPTPRVSSSSMRRSILVLTLLATSASAQEIRFNRDVRPILAEHCYQCHGPDSASRKA